VVEEVFGPASAWVLAPFFLQGGRLTIDDVHYVADADGDTLVPAGQTEFARDASFGYSSSHLADWVREKAPAHFSSIDDDNRIHSISLTDIRKGPSQVESVIDNLPERALVIVNAISESDMDVFVAGLVRSQRKSGRKFLFRTAAAFVSSRLAIQSRAPLTASDLGLTRVVAEGQTPTGGLVVVGSYVPKTTSQVDSLIRHRAGKLETVTLAVDDILSEEESAVIERAARRADEAIRGGTDVLVMTERTLKTGADRDESLDINRRVADALVRVVKAIPTRPRFFIAKGGITSR
jgi:uncharacterized protein YgbK (DUF1537 family)